MEGEGTRERPPPRNGKICCRNLVFFSKALFLATTFPEIIDKSFFIDFSCKIFSTSCVFRPNARKWNAWFFKNFEKYSKIYIFAYILRLFLKNFSRFFPNFLKDFAKLSYPFCFCPNAQKSNAWFFKNFGKIC